MVARVSVRVVSNALPRLERALPARARRAIADELAAVTADAKRFAPVDTGELRADIHAEGPGGSAEQPTGAVVASVDHAAPQEFGFRHYLSGRFIPAQPYLRPAAALGLRRFPSRVGGHLGAWARGL